MGGRGVVFQMCGTSFLRGDIGFDGGVPPPHTIGNPAFRGPLTFKTKLYVTRANRAWIEYYNTIHENSKR